MPTGYFAPTTDVLWQLLDDRGLDANTVFGEVGIDPECISDSNARLPFEKVAALWQRVLELTRDPYLGLRCNAFFNLAHLGGLGAAWVTSVDLRTGLQRVERYSRLLSNNRQMWIEPGRQASVVALTVDSAPGAVQRADAVMACLHGMCRWRAGKDFRPLRVQFHHALPDDVAIYRQLFGCEVEFDCSHDRMVIANAVLDRPLPGGDPQLARLNEEYLCECLARLDRDDLRTRVMAQILDELPSGTVRMAQVARGLHLSSRTLQRRLGALGTSFSGLLDETRRELTLQLLRDQSKSLTEIAFSTGFSSLSAFSTAVRQWTGNPPSRFRESG